MLQKHIQHFYWRAGFGESYKIVNDSEKLSAKQLFKKIRKDSEDFRPIDVVDMREIVAELKQLREMRNMKKDEKMELESAREKFKDLKKEQKEEQGTLNTTWLDLMSAEKGALREKMSLFWHGHLVSRSLNPVFSQKYLNTIREFALGKFGDLLIAVSQEPSMLQFLNNKQNKKRSPNENFARELMELFTLGRGNYTENDIKEVARAFTGWDFDFQGRFVFKENQHDDGEKIIFGKKGNFKGEGVIQMILERRETAQFITTKIYKYFVNEQINGKEKRIAELAKRFYKTNYDISDLLENIFTAEWFYDQENIGTHIKSPVELLIGMKRNLGFTFEAPQSNLFIQKVLGQVLLYPPNVAGWAGGRNWIDSSSLLFRLQLPATIFLGKQSETTAKNDGDVNTEYQSKKKGFKANINWQQFSDDFSKNYIDELSQYLLQAPVNDAFLQEITNRNPNESKEEAIKKIALALMMLPEYQVC
jgi:uncharacterized protein (DUF1800 family)